MPQRRRQSSQSIFPETSIHPTTDEDGRPHTLERMVLSARTESHELDEATQEAQVSVEIREKLSLILAENPELCEESGKMLGEGCSADYILVKLEKMVANRHRRIESAQTVPARVPGIIKARPKPNTRVRPISSSAAPETA